MLPPIAVGCPVSARVISTLLAIALTACDGTNDASINLANIENTDGFRLDGESYRSNSGRSVASAGDVNGDGYDDIIIGAPGPVFGNEEKKGYGYVVFGKEGGFTKKQKLSELNVQTGFRLEGISKGDFTGISVASAGDVNGDSFDDIIIGAYRADSNGTSSGASYVIFGKKNGFGANVNLATLNGKIGFRLNGVAKYDRSGSSVASAGDVNGDGFDDIIIGAPHADPNKKKDSGSSYVIFGKRSGFAATMNLSALNGRNGFRLNGADSYDESGNAVASAGDINGDGYDDIIIGARQADPNGSQNGGSSYVIFGKRSGFAATMNLSALNGRNGFRLNGADSYDESGNAVASAGDINGDGYDDIIIGARQADKDYSTDNGAAYVVFGKKGKFDDTVNLASLDKKNGFHIAGVSSYDRSGTSVASAGDVNGDGYDDIIIGAHNSHQNGEGSGSSYVLFGKKEGFDAAIKLSKLNGRNGFSLTGAAKYDESGFSVASAGDVNGDDIDDIIIGAYQANSNDSGSSYVIFGKKEWF